jgi:predicted CopG family antitoxin
MRKSFIGIVRSDQSPQQQSIMGYRLKPIPIPVAEVQCNGLKTISLHDATYYRIRQYGREGDSYEDIINKLCDVVDGKRRRSSVIVTDSVTLHHRLSENGNFL